MALSYITRAEFRALIVDRLGDSSNIHWTAEEIDFFTNEALYTFGAVANYFKTDVVLSSVEDQIYYDLTDAAVVQPANILSLNLTAAWLVQALNYHLLESLSDASPTGEFITIGEVYDVIKDKISELQLTAGLILSQITLPIPSAPAQIVTLPDNVIDIIRVVFRDEDDVAYVLKRDSEGYVEIATPNYNDLTRTPRYYLDVLTDSAQQVRIYPPANVPGTLEMLVVTAPDLAEDTDEPITIPDNLVPYIKWGVLAAILNKDGILNDPSRAAYCEQRWNEGLFIAKQYTSLLKGYSNDRIATMDSLDHLDSLYGKWMNQAATDRAFMFALAGYNMLLPCRVPSANTQGWRFNAVVNATIPANDGDFIQVKNEYLPVFVKYVYHLLMFKDGMSDLKRTQDGLEDFLKAALQYNDRLKERGISYQALLDKTKLQEQALSKPLVETPYQNG